MSEDFEAVDDDKEYVFIPKACLAEFYRAQRFLPYAIQELKFWRGLTIVLGLGELALLALFYWRAAPWV